MKSVEVKLIGGLGNRMFMWAHAAALAEQNGYELRHEPWIGEHIFTLTNKDALRPNGKADIVLSSYFQDQKSLIYSREDCRRWFKMHPWIERELPMPIYWPHAHLRRGDYKSAGYPLIGRKSIDTAVAQLQFPGDLRENMVPGREYVVVSDDSPMFHPKFIGDMSMLPDFNRLMRAPVLYRANSSFSWWAATLGYGTVFSPIITGFMGGMEHDTVPYCEGNWPRLAELEFVTDLHLRET